MYLIYSRITAYSRMGWLRWVGALKLYVSFAKEPYKRDIYENISNIRTHSRMGWLRWVGALKLYVSVAECRLFYRALLQKRPIILRSLLIVATPYHIYCGYIRVLRWWAIYTIQMREHIYAEDTYIYIKYTKDTYRYIVNTCSVYICVLCPTTVVIPK